MARLRDKYRKEVVPRLMEICGYKNIMQVPRLEKIVVNVGMGEAISNAKALESAEADLMAITGQHVLTTRSKKAIANFKLRIGMPIGLKVTLRGNGMWQFYVYGLMATHKNEFKHLAVTILLVLFGILGACSCRWNNKHESSLGPL